MPKKVKGAKAPAAKEEKAVQTAEIVPPRDFTAERDTEVIPAAKELLARILLREDLMIGSSQKVNAEKAAEYYQKVYQEDVVPMLLARNLRLADVPYLFSLMLQPIQLLMDVTNGSFNMNRGLADAKKWGVKDIDDLRVVDLDEALKAPLPGETVDESSAAA